MKKITLGLLLLLATIISTSCSNDDDNSNNRSDENAVLNITIKGQSTPKYVGQPTTAAESFVSNFTVFVFNDVTGDLEKSQGFTVTGTDYTKQVTGLSTGTSKKIVVYVNVPEGLDLSGITNYNNQNLNIITLDSQNGDNITSTGLFMSGEATGAISLNANTTNTVTVPVSRRVAKVVLTNLIVQPGNPADLNNFTLTAVSIQKARLTGTPFGGIVNPAGQAPLNYAGGIISPTGADPFFNEIRGYLLDSIALPAGYVSGTNLITDPTQERYFYILPNDGINNHATLMTIAGRYGTTTQEDAYYTFEINSTVGSGASGTDGNYIESNKVYQLSVTIRRLNLPSEDPNIVPSEVNLDVTIVPQEWSDTINQPVEW